MVGPTDAMNELLAKNTPPGEEAAIVARYRTTEQFKSAWEIIAPVREHEAECGYRIVYAILLIQWDTVTAKRVTRVTVADRIKDLEKRIKKIWAAEGAVENEYLEYRLTAEREHMEKELAMLLGPMGPVRGKGKPRRNEIKATAVHRARELLKFGNKEPTLYRDGAWHNLAKVLFGGHDRTDLFEYLERYSPPPQWSEITADGGREPITTEEPLWSLARRVAGTVG